MKKEIHYFLTAILFFTRIPCPKWVDHSPDVLNKSSRYFSLVGIIVGAFAVLIYYLASLIFPANISILMSMIASIWITGAFHEDGFADVCDGFGGGWPKKKNLIIMKDSRLGTFGVVGILSILLLKFLALNELNTSIWLIIWTIISGHSISRFTATLLLYTHLYVRDDESSKVKPSTNQMDTISIVLSGIFGILPLFAFQNYWVFLSLIPLILTYLYMGRFFKKWIGGQTGDCAGALQQVSEIVFYLSMIALWKFF